MSVYDYELVRCNGSIKAFVRIQNDWTGQIRDSIKCIIDDKNGRYHMIADGQRIDVTAAREKFIQYEEYIRECIKWRKQTDFRSVERG